MRQTLPNVVKNNPQRIKDIWPDHYNLEAEWEKNVVRQDLICRPRSHTINQKLIFLWRITVDINSGRRAYKFGIGIRTPVIANKLHTDHTQWDRKLIFFWIKNGMGSAMEVLQFRHQIKKWHRMKRNIRRQLLIHSKY